MNSERKWRDWFINCLQNICTFLTRVNQFGSADKLYRVYILSCLAHWYTGPVIGVYKFRVLIVFYLYLNIFLHKIGVWMVKTCDLLSVKLFWYIKHSATILSGPYAYIHVEHPVISDLWRIIAPVIIIGYVIIT